MNPFCRRPEPVTAFTYDGDGKRVKAVEGSKTTLFVGAHYEVTTDNAPAIPVTTTSKYYFAGTQRIAMRKYTIPQTMSVEYMLGDHIGSTSLTTDSAGNKVSEIRYKPFGETRYTWTDSALNNPANPDDKASPVYALTKYQFTGQYSYESEFGLMFYQSRFYDPSLGRFASADSIVPAGVQGYDRYAYVNNNPVNFTDPSGHTTSCSTGDCGAGGSGRITKSSPGAFHEPDENHHYTYYGSQSPLNILDFTGYAASVLTSRIRDPRFLAMKIDMMGGWFGLLEAEYPTGGWDIKVKMEDQSLLGTGLCDDKGICAYYDYSTIGNIQLGYLAGLLHMHKSTVDGAGGVVNSLDYYIRGLPDATPGPHWYSDDPRDQAAVDFGYYLAGKSEYQNGITRDQLSVELGKSPYTSSFQPPRSDWMQPYPAGPGPDLYGPNDFDNDPW